MNDPTPIPPPPPQSVAGATVATAVPTLGGIAGSIAAMKIASIPAVIALGPAGAALGPLVAGLVVALFHWAGQKTGLSQLG